MLLERNSKLLFIGDSITDAGRAQPVGEGLGDALGRGYVAMVDALLGACHPEAAIRVVNMGTGGHTVRDLKKRWHADVTAQNPDWVAVMIGVNDVWRQFDSPLRPETHVYIEEYESTLNDLIERTMPAVHGMILMTPFYMEANHFDPMRAQIDRYGDVVKRLALRHDVVLVDVQKAFDGVLGSYYPATLGWDRVHPGAVGCAVIARAFLKTIDMQW